MQGWAVAGLADVLTRSNSALDLRLQPGIVVA